MKFAMVAGSCLVLSACTQAPPLAAFQRSVSDEAYGCWVNAYGRTQYRPPLTTYTGPSHEPRLVKGTRSLVVGNHARFQGYAGEGGDAPIVVLPAGSRVPDLAQTAFGAKLASFDVSCVSGNASAPPGEGNPR